VADLLALGVRRYGDLVLSAGRWMSMRRGCRRSCWLGCLPQVSEVSVHWPFGCVIFWRKPFRPPGYHRSCRRVTSSCRWLFTRFFF